MPNNNNWIGNLPNRPPGKTDITRFVPDPQNAQLAPEEERGGANWLKTLLRYAIPTLAGGAMGVGLSRQAGFEAPHGGTLGWKGTMGKGLQMLSKNLKQQEETERTLREAQEMREAEQAEKEQKRLWDVYQQQWKETKFREEQKFEKEQARLDRESRELLAVIGKQPKDMSPRDWAYIADIKSKIKEREGKGMADLDNVYKIGEGVESDLAQSYYKGILDTFEAGVQSGDWTNYDNYVRAFATGKQTGMKYKVKETLKAGEKKTGFLGLGEKEKTWGVSGRTKTATEDVNKLQRMIKELNKIRETTGEAVTPGNLAKQVIDAFMTDDIATQNRLMEAYGEEVVRTILRAAGFESNK